MKYSHLIILNTNCESVPGRKFLHPSAESNLQKEGNSSFTLHYNIYSDVGKETYVLPWAPRKLYPDLRAETHDICIFLRSVLVLLMNIDRYDPMFECRGVGKLGAEANWAFWAESRYVQRLAEKLGLAKRSIIEKITKIIWNYKRDASYFSTLLFKAMLYILHLMQLLKISINWYVTFLIHPSCRRVKESLIAIRSCVCNSP